MDVSQATKPSQQQQQQHKEPKNTLHFIFHTFAQSQPSSQTQQQPPPPPLPPPTSSSSASQNNAQSSTATPSKLNSEDVQASSEDQEAYEKKLGAVYEQISTKGLAAPSPLLANLVIESAAVSDKYLAFLLDNGKVCRIGYKVIKSESNPSVANTTSSTNQVPNEPSRTGSNVKHLKGIISSTSGTGSSSLSAAALSLIMGSSSSSSNSSSSSYRTRTIVNPSSFTSSATTTTSTSGNSSSGGNVPPTTTTTNQLPPPVTSSSSVRSSGEAFIMPSTQDMIVSSRASAATSSGGGTTSSGSVASVAAAAAAAAAVVSQQPTRTHRAGHHSQLLRGRVSSLIAGAARLPPPASAIMVPASAVPESLIESVQTVLQSKSRSVIVRELQRTNLDVNLAVNNLLQRDDEGGDGGDQTTDDEEPYLHGDELISLLDINAAAAAAAAVATNTTSSSSSSHHHGLHHSHHLSGRSDSALLEAAAAAASVGDVVVDASNNDHLSSVLFDEDTFRFARRFGTSASGNTSTGSTARGLNLNRIVDAAAAAAAATSGGTTSSTARKSYRIRDSSSSHHRFYDSYRSAGGSSVEMDHLFSTSYHHRNSGGHQVITSSSNYNSGSDSDRNESTTATGKQQSKEQTSTSQEFKLEFGSTLEYWHEKLPASSSPPNFIKIVSLYSELVALSKDGRLYQWKWNDSSPFVSSVELDAQQQYKVFYYHPKTVELQLLNERVCDVVASPMRAACYTESGKLACWLDELVDAPLVRARFQTAAYNFHQEIKPSSSGLAPTNQSDKIAEISTSNLFTVVRLFSGSVYWTGIMPYELRAKSFDKYQSKNQKINNTMSSSSDNVITTGSLVCLKSRPVYSIGCLALSCKHGRPRLGQLAEHVFSFRDLSRPYRFRPLKSDKSLLTLDQIVSSDDRSSSIKPEPPTATQQPQQPLVGSLKRKKSYRSGGEADIRLKEQSQQMGEEESGDEMDEEQDESSREEMWWLNEVVFMDEHTPGGVSHVLGRVIKIDNDYVLVKLGASDSNISNSLENTRIFQKSQLQLVSNNSSSSATSSSVSTSHHRYTDFMQRSPKRLSDLSSATVLTILARQSNIHAIISKENSIYYVQYDMLACKIVKEKRFSTGLQAFLGSTVANTHSIANKMMLSALHDSSCGLMTLLDGNSTFYPLVDLTGSSASSTSSVKDPEWKNLFPVKCFTQHVLPIKQPSSSTSGSQRTVSFLTFFSMRVEQLLVSIVRSDTSRLVKILRQLECDAVHTGSNAASKKLKRVLRERADGNRNILHVAVMLSAPTTSNHQNLDMPAEINKIGSSASKAATQSEGESTSSGSANTTGPQLFAPVKLSDRDRRQTALNHLHLLLVSPVLTGKLANTTSINYNYLYQLMCQKNAHGQTPFMYAVSLRAYEAAWLLLDSALQIRSELGIKIAEDSSISNYDRDLSFTNMIYPLHSSIDQSPLYMLCSNDTCSFTWTGDHHITQDIFECRTCTLVGNLCCCTECARTCHQGHDCKIKTSSPTAYCDCWEKCKCKSLVAGNQDKRFELVDKLLDETDLLHMTNYKSEHLILFLVQTVHRQMQEQKNYKRLSTSSSSSASTTNSSTSSGSNNLGSSYRRYGHHQHHDIQSSSSASSIGGGMQASGSEINLMPQHDLEPPKFCRRVLERIFGDWACVKQIFLFNYSRMNTTDNKDESDDSSDSEEDDIDEKENKESKKSSKGHRSFIFDEFSYVDNQSGSIDLDKFVYYLVMKLPYEFLKCLVETIKSRLQVNSESEEETMTETRQVVRRLIRSIARLFVILCIETAPTSLQLNLGLSLNGVKSSIPLAQQQVQPAQPSSAGLTRQTSLKYCRVKNVNQLLIDHITSSSANNASSSASNTPPTLNLSPVAKCEYVFREFSRYSVNELTNVAHSLITPIILGTAKPTILKVSIQSSSSSTSLTGGSGGSSSTAGSTNSGTLLAGSDYHANHLMSGSTSTSTVGHSLTDELFNLEPPFQRQMASVISMSLVHPSAKALRRFYSQSSRVSKKPSATTVFSAPQQPPASEAQPLLQQHSQLPLDNEENSSSNSYPVIAPPPPPPFSSTSALLPPPQPASAEDTNASAITSNRNELFADLSPENSTSITANAQPEALTTATTGASTSGAANQRSSSAGSSSSSRSASSRATRSSAASGSKLSSIGGNSNDTTFTASSTSTNQTKRSTMAVRNGRSGRGRRGLSTRSEVDNRKSRRTTRNAVASSGENTLSNIISSHASRHRLQITTPQAQGGSATVDSTQANPQPAALNQSQASTTSVSRPQIVSNNSEDSQLVNPSYFSDDDEEEMPIEDEDDDEDDEEDEYKLSTSEEEEQDRIIAGVMADVEKLIGGREGSNLVANSDIASSVAGTVGSRLLEQQEVDNDEEDDDVYHDDETNDDPEDDTTRMEEDEDDDDTSHSVRKTTVTMPQASASSASSSSSSSDGGAVSNPANPSTTLLVIENTRFNDGIVDMETNEDDEDILTEEEEDEEEFDDEDEDDDSSGSHSGHSSSGESNGVESSDGSGSELSDVDNDESTNSSTSSIDLENNNESRTSSPNQKSKRVKSKDVSKSKRQRDKKAVPKTANVVISGLLLPPPPPPPLPIPTATAVLVQPPPPPQVTSAAHSFIYPYLNNSSSGTNGVAASLPTSNSNIGSSTSLPPIDSVSVVANTQPSSIAITNNTLARVFSILLKLVRELLAHVKLDTIGSENNNIVSSFSREDMDLVLYKLIQRVNRKLDLTWHWLISIMDSTEAQLRFGSSLSQGSQSNSGDSQSSHYLRHLEEKALLYNYFTNSTSTLSNMNNNTSSANNYYYNYYSSSGGGLNSYMSNNTGSSGSSFLSSRFGSGIDARRKLTIMQHQHQHYNTHLNTGTTSGGSSSQQQQQQQQQQMATFQHLASSQAISSRRDFLNYTLSLMRAHTNEHRDLLPTIDIAVLKHTAYVFDAIMFYLRTRATFSSMSRSSLPSSALVSASRAVLSKSTNNILLDTYKSIKKKLKNEHQVNSEDTSSSESECELDKVETYKVEAGSDMDNFDEDYEEDDEASSQSEDEIKKARKSKGDEYDEIYDSESSSIKLGRLKRVDHDEDFSSMVESSDDDEESPDLRVSKVSKKSGSKPSSTEKKQNEESQEASNKPVRYQLRRPCTRKATFFKRSDSTLCLGGRAPDPFSNSLDESLPLVTRPHLLQPHARIQDMFRVSSDHSSQFRSLRRIGLMSSELRFNYPKLDTIKHSTGHTNIKKTLGSGGVTNEQTSAKRPLKKSGSSRKLTRFERSMSNVLASTTTRQQSKRVRGTGDPVDESVIFNPDELIDRWRLTIDLFGRVFCDDVGLEPASLIRQLGGFQLKEAKFRREMERLRNLATRELCIDVDREREKLMQATFKSLNNMYYLQYNRRMASAQVVNSSSVMSKSSAQLITPPLLCLSRVKITFRDEQGEGSGVARSFYTAFAEAVLADADMPSLVDALNPSHASSPTSSNAPGGVLASHQQYVPFTMHRYRSSPTTRSTIYTSGSSLHESASGRRITATSSSMANPASNTAPAATAISPPNTSNIVIRSSYSTRSSSSLTSPRSDPLILHPSSTTRPTTNYSSSSGSNSLLDQYHQLLSVEPFPTTSSRVQASPTGGAAATAPPPSNTTSSTTTTTAPPPPDTTPLFWQPDKQRSTSSSGGGGFYSPRAGKLSQQRLNAHRNIGRIIGICLLQNELCPIQLSRHVIKHILGRSVRWHDLAFYDPQMYESLRKMVLDAEQMLAKLVSPDNEKKMSLREAIRECNEQLFKPLELTFNIDLPSEEDGGNHDLVENGKHIPVTCVNMYEFVKRYAEYRMVKRVEPCLQQLRQGVLDVLPPSALDNITAEEFRLLLNGVADVNIHTLASYTTISDESKESGRRPQFEKWFWSTLDKMNQQEKQELLFFWTGSPYLPASEEGFQPLPTITLRPPSDQHLPTANTCINRLYLPLYSSKSILKSKLLQAIKTKTFGFV